jgi:hypothetical protein
LYTPGQVIEILLRGSEDHDEELDVGVGLERMTEREGVFLRLLAQGVGIQDAMNRSGATGNQTRFYERVILKLVRVINEGRG